MQVLAATPTQQAPGCFGSASIYALDSKMCKQCPSYQACGEQAHDVLMRIKGRINVQDLLKLHQKARIEADAAKAAQEPPEPPAKPVAQPSPITEPVVRATPLAQVKFAVSAQDQATIDRMGNTKVKAVAVSLAQNNRLEYVRDSLRNGRNPFAGRLYPNMRVAVEMLLQGGFTKASLAQRYVQALGWTEGTAASQRAGALCMLQALDVVREQGGVFTLKTQ